MKRILLSLVTLAIAGAIITGATTAIFSDEEVSTGNTFTAGAIDLQIDNESYYNGEFNEGTSWLQADLDDGNGPSTDGAYLFFEFDDLKPGDWGEDTISLHVNDNESWVCADVTLTSNQDNGSTEPELNDEDPYTPEIGELADQVHFLWWADDGDNVLESDERTLPGGALGALQVGQTVTVPLADSQGNIWGDDGGLPGDSVRYIGKGWCFGDLQLDPVTQDDLGQTDGRVNGPLERGEGFTCNGAPVDNETQTDSMTADIAFRAEQSRNNGNFVCDLPTTSLTVIKTVINDDNGDALVSDFALSVSPDVGSVTSGVVEEVTPGDYNVTEDGPAGYVLTYGGDCDANGNVTVSENENAICTLTNDDDDVGAITVNKIVAFSSDEIIGVEITDFALFIDDGNGPVAVTDEVKVSGLAPGTYTVSEVYSGDPSGVVYDAQFTGACVDNGDTGTITLAADDDVTCTLTNIVSVDPV